MRSKIKITKENAEEKLENSNLKNGYSLPFITSRKNILSSYFQMINLMLLSRVNGDTANSDSVLKSEKEELNDEIIKDFGFKNEEVFGEGK